MKSIKFKPAKEASNILTKLRSHFYEVSSSALFHLFFAGIVVVLVFVRPPDIFFGDIDTARNYLNTIVSSLSTILALCISIILVAIQMSAGNYTHRVLDFYVRLPYNVSLFLFYLATIMHSFFLMARIRDPFNDPLPRSLGLQMSADLVMVVICFFSLLFYMYAVVQLLKPDRIIDLIVREYKRAYDAGRYKSALENIEQICDIAKRAASFSDSVTGMHCVEVMGSIAKGLPLPDSMEDKVVMIHRNIVDQFVEIFGVAVKEQETSVVQGVLDALSEQGFVYIRGEAWPVAELVIRAYRRLTFNYLLTEGHVYYIDGVVSRMYPLARQASECSARGQTFAVRTWQVIRSIGEIAVSAHPTSVPALLSGFLMSDGALGTLSDLEQEDEHKQALVLYFGLWKVLVSDMALRDAARWARWWKERAPDRVRRVGAVLGSTLALHIGRQDIEKTLQYTWNEPSPGTGSDEGERLQIWTMDNRKLLEPYSAELFDGWPMPSG